MDTIPDICVKHVMDYFDRDSAYNIRITERRLGNILDRHKSWENNNNKRIILNNSIGLSYLSIRDSIYKWSCISCKNENMNDIHPFYNVPVCSICSSSVDFFKTLTVNQACNLFFIGKEDIEHVPKRYKTSKSKLVLYNKAKECGEKKNGVVGLKNMIFKRESRRKLLFIKRKKAVNDRIRTIKNKTWFLLNSNYSRIDAVFMDVGRLFKVMHRNSLSKMIMGDTFEFKLKTRVSTEIVSNRLFDLACMLSYCKEMGIVMADHVTINTIIHDGFHIPSVFKKHIRGGKHFYVHISEYMKSIDILYNRSKDVQMYISKNRIIESYDRRVIATKICTEEGIVMREEIFRDFIEFGIGDPVLIAREDRKLGFLLDRGLDAGISFYENDLGFSFEESEYHAKMYIFNNFGGFPIFTNIFVDDSIPSLYC